MVWRAGRGWCPTVRRGPLPTAREVDASGGREGRCDGEKERTREEQSSVQPARHGELQG
jgi:hypothetical protein